MLKVCFSVSVMLEDCDLLTTSQSDGMIGQ